MLKLNFGDYEIELVNESTYSENSSDNIVNYDFVYKDAESEFYHSTNHGIRVFKDGKVIASSVICAVGGATGIHENCAVIADNDILICCADCIFSLSLPSLNLNWLKKVDDATCFSIYKTKNGLFVHGELNASRINKNGEILWSVGFADILVTPDGKESFTICDEFIEVVDWEYRNYKVDFDGKFI
jgi:hypothetical protein